MLLLYAIKISKICLQCSQMSDVWIVRTLRAEWQLKDKQTCLITTSHWYISLLLNVCIGLKTVKQCGFLSVVGWFCNRLFISLFLPLSFVTTLLWISYPPPFGNVVWPSEWHSNWICFYINQHNCLWLRDVCECLCMCSSEQGVWGSFLV